MILKPCRTCGKEVNIKSYSSEYFPDGIYGPPMSVRYYYVKCDSCGSYSHGKINYSQQEAADAYNKDEDERSSREAEAQGQRAA